MSPGYNRLDVFPAQQRHNGALANSIISLDTSRYKLTSERAELSRIKRFSSGEHTLTWLGQYRFAYEKGRGRGGGYYSAGLWLEDGWLDGFFVESILEKCCDMVRSACVQDFECVASVSDHRALFERELGDIVSHVQSKLRPIESQTLGTRSGGRRPLYDLHSIRRSTGFFWGYFQVSALHRTADDIVFTSSQEVTDASAMVGYLEIVNPSLLVALEAQAPADKSAALGEVVDQVPAEPLAGSPLGLGDMDTQLELQLLSEKISRLERADKLRWEQASEQQRKALMRMLIILSVAAVIVVPVAAELWRYALDSVLSGRF